MANKLPTKTTVKVGSVSPRPFDLSSQTITTSDFGKVAPVLVRDTVPNSTYNVKPMSFVRTAPLAVPTFGRIKCYLDTFFVPYFQVWKYWDNFINNIPATSTSGTQTSITSVPYFTQDTLLGVFMSENNGLSEKTPYQISSDEVSLAEFLSPANPRNLVKGDFTGSLQLIENESSETPAYIVSQYDAYTLTPKGKIMWNILHSLGYKPNFVYGISPISVGTYYPTADAGKLSALRLLSFVKSYIDWFYPAQYSRSSAIKSVFEKIRDFNLGSAISTSDLSVLFTYYVRAYKEDLYTSCFTTPGGAYNDNTSLPNDYIPFSPGLGERITSDSNSATLNQYVNVSGSRASILQRDLSMLERVQQFIDRIRVGGSRAIDRYLIEFGVKSDSTKADRSNLVHSFSYDIQISDVMSNSDTTGASLGDFAGKATGFGSDGFSFHTNDFGVLFTTLSILPVTGYVYGIDRNILNIKPYEFYTPEYDCVGVEAIPFKQLRSFVSSDYTFGSYTPDSVFGYLPRYSSLKVGSDTLSGDFVVNTLGAASGASESWHLFRNTKMPDFANTRQMRQCLVDDDTYNWQGGYDNYDRIFQNTAAGIDHFYFVLQFDISAMLPMLPISDYYDLNHPDDGHKHNEINIDYNGKQL